MISREAQQKIHARNVEKGFYDYKEDIDLIDKWLVCAMHDGAVTPEQDRALRRILDDYEKAMFERKLLLVIGEVVEAHEELRSGHKPAEVYFNDVHDSPSPKPEGVPVELADAAIRLLDVAESEGIDLGAEMQRKHDFNGTRPHRHGKDF